MGRKSAGNEETGPLRCVTAAAGAGPHDTESHRVAGLQLRLDFDHVLDGGDRLPVDGHYYVLLKQTDILGKRAGIDTANDQAAFTLDAHGSALGISKRMQLDTEFILALFGLGGVV